MSASPSAAHPLPREHAAPHRVYDQVKLMAMTYVFRPGERINEIELAARLGVSRTPLREALNRLVSEGFLTTLPNRGFFGRLLDAKEILDLYEFRCALEQTIVRLVCARASDVDLDGLAAFAASRPPAQGGKSLAGLHHDEAFHLRIAALTGNAEFVRSLEGVNSRIQFVRWIDMRKHPVLGPDPHTRLVDLLRARDAEACAEAVGQMIRRRREEIVAVIRDGLADIYAGPEEPGG